MRAELFYRSQFLQQLDVEKHPCRPQYSLASEIPLNLFDCQFDNFDQDGNRLLGDWVFDQDALETVSQVPS